MINREMVSIVVPVFNEEDVIAEFYSRTFEVLKQLQEAYEILFIDDGSTDSTPELLAKLSDQDPQVGVLRLSRNFGKEIAMTAGLDHASGSAIIIIDADLQDPPELIPELLKRWRNGNDVVYATRTAREGESWLKRTTAYSFYRVINRMAGISLPKDTGDYRLLSRRAADAVLQLRERHRFMKGIFAWVGFAQTGVGYQRDRRYAGQTKWGYWRLWNFAIDGITSFTTMPLKWATYLGISTALVAFLYGLVIIVKKVLFGNPVPGYSSLMVTILFIGGVQLITVGIIGEYLGRMFDETKDRPLYFVAKYDASALSGKDVCARKFECKRDAARRTENGKSA